MQINGTITFGPSTDGSTYHAWTCDGKMGFAGFTELNFDAGPAGMAYAYLTSINESYSNMSWAVEHYWGQGGFSFPTPMFEGETPYQLLQTYNGSFPFDEYIESYYPGTTIVNSDSNWGTIVLTIDPAPEPSTLLLLGLGLAGAAVARRKFRKR